MKTTHQVLLCAVGAIIFFALYLGGGSETSQAPQQSEAYNIKGVHNQVSEAELNKQLFSDNQAKSLVGFTKYRYRHEYHLNVDGRVDRTTFKFPIPQDEIGKQYISNLKISPKPTKLYSTGTNIIAEYNLKDLKAGKYVYTIDAIADIKKYDITAAKRNNKVLEKENNINRYLIAENNIEVDHPYIKQIANKIEGNSTEEIVDNIFKYVKNKIHYTTTTQGTSAVKALKSGRGKCGEYAIAMVSLCRAKGIPARIVSGNIAREKDQKHTWVEVYFNNYGWVLYDPTDQNAQIYSSKQNYVSAIRNDLVSWYISYSQVNTGYNGNISVDENIMIKEIR